MFVLHTTWQARKRKQTAQTINPAFHFAKIGIFFGIFGVLLRLFNANMKPLMHCIWLLPACWLLSLAIAHGQTADSLKKELAYWYKHPAEWKTYKQQIAAQQANHAKHLDTLKSYQNFKEKLQEMYDLIADRAERADSLIATYTGIAEALRKKQTRQRHGLTFRIQIQTAKDNPIDKYATANTQLTIERASKTSKKYLIGEFKVYEEAQAWAEVLRNAGTPAYVVAYKKGQRLANFTAYLD